MSKVQFPLTKFVAKGVGIGKLIKTGGSECDDVCELHKIVLRFNVGRFPFVSDRPPRYYHAIFERYHRTVD